MQAEQKRKVYNLYQSQNNGIGGAVLKSESFNPSKNGAEIYLNGGKILQQKMLVNEQVGFIASFEDTEGNEIYLHAKQSMDIQCLFQQ